MTKQGYMDEYGVAHNCKELYKKIAERISCRTYDEDRPSVIISWGDGEGTMYDILFTYEPEKITDEALQGGIREEDLFVSVMRKGAFAFEITNNYLSGGYISEKLGIDSRVTATKLAELIEGVRVELLKRK